MEHEDFSSTVDTSRPFSSVKEAVAIFGERLQVGEIYSPKPPLKSHEEEKGKLGDIIKKLEAELEQTKEELNLLKERGTQTEVALATLNAQLHKNMSNLALAEASAAGKAAAAATTKTVTFQISQEEESQSLLSLTENDHLFGPKKDRKHKQKHKPIIPLVGDFFFNFKRKATSTTTHHNPLYASPF